MCAVVCDLSRKAECVPTFACESKRRPFVREVEKRDKRRSEIELLLIVGVHREPGNVYIKAWWNQGLQMLTTYSIVRSLDHAAQRGRDAFGTATRMSVSLFRRLSAFSGAHPAKTPKRQSSPF